MKKQIFSLLCFSILILSGCSRQKPVSPVLSVGLKEYKGQYITFQYPSSGQLYVVSPEESYILGPRIPLYPLATPNRSSRIPTPTATVSKNSEPTLNEEDPPPPLPAPLPPIQIHPQGESKYAYQIHIQLFENLMKLSTEAWARAHIIHEWKRTRGGLSIYPVTEDGHIIESQVSHVQIGKLSAFMMDTYGFDDQTRTLFISKDKIIIAFSFTLYSGEVDPFASLQKDIYALILGTLKWSK
jgi:hypothetical protein